MKNIKYNPITGNFEETFNADWEEYDWKYAIEVNSVHWYERYLKDYPQGKYIQEAKNRLRLVKSRRN